MNTIPVLLDRCNTYSSSKVYEKIDSLLDELQITHQNLKGSKVLLKPNLITGRAPGCACTHPIFIAEVARWFIDQGANVCVGDSPAYGTAKGVMKSHGILKDLESQDVKIIEFKETKTIYLKDGHKIGVAAEPYECDLFINLPKVKAHNQMYVTLATKNLFGLVKGQKKALLHMSHGNDHQQFSRMLLELVHLLPECTTIVDGIEVMHKAGPIKGEPLSLGCIAASKDPIALDFALMDVLGLSTKRSPLLNEAIVQKLVQSNSDLLDYPRLQPADFDNHGFIPPQSLTEISFHPVKLIKSRLKRAIMKFTS